MPFTPFHFGPGLLAKGLAARWFSWSAFAASTVVIDCESGYYMVRGEYPLHRQLHTFVGAALAGIATIGMLLGARWMLSRARVWLAAQPPTVRAEATTLGVITGAMTGALTHPLLDGLMHADIEPFAPWTADNPLRGLVGLEALHQGCLIAGLAGAVLIVVWRMRERKA